MHLVDVHIIESRVARWATRCLDSLSTEPVNVHVSDWVDGDIRLARKNGFALGTAPFVSFVDADDVVYPGAFSACISALNNHPKAVAAYTLCDRIDIHGASLGVLHPFRPWAPPEVTKCLQEVHQLCVMKREPLMRVFDEEWDAIPLMTYAELFIYAALREAGDFIPVNVVGYGWRIHESNASSTHLPPAADLQRIYTSIHTRYAKALANAPT